MATNAPVYSAYISSEYGYRIPQSDIISGSPNSGFVAVSQFPFLPSGKLFKMRCSSFHIEDPASKNDSRGFVPYNDRGKTTGIGPAKVGQIVIESRGPEVCWKNFSCVNGEVNWPSVKTQILGQFDADSGDNLNSPWTLISAPLAQPVFEISLRAANGMDFLVDRTNSGDLAPLDHWTIGVEFMPLTPTEIETYFPYRNPFPGGNTIFNYSDSIPEADLLEVCRTNAQGFVPMQRVWVKIEKNNVPNPYFNIDEVNLHAGGNGSSVTIVADVFDDIDDDTATNPTDAFAGLQSVFTTPEFTIQDEGGGTQPVILDLSSYNNFGRTDFWIAIRDVNGQGYDLPANFTIEGDVTTDNNVGASNDAKTVFEVHGMGRPYVGDLNY